MRIRLQADVEGAVSAREMLDGTIGIIVAWPTDPSYCGKIVQRYRNDLVAVGEDCSHTWLNYFRNTAINDDDHRVRPLKPGETLIVE